MYKHDKYGNYNYYEWCDYICKKYIGCSLVDFVCNKADSSNVSIKNDFTQTILDSVGGNEVHSCFEAVKNKVVDLVPEYTNKDGVTAQESIRGRGLTAIASIEEKDIAYFINKEMAAKMNAPSLSEYWNRGINDIAKRIYRRKDTNNEGVEQGSRKWPIWRDVEGQNVQDWKGKIKTTADLKDHINTKDNLVACMSALLKLELHDRASALLNDAINERNKEMLAFFANFFGQSALINLINGFVFPEIDTSKYLGWLYANAYGLGADKVFGLVHSTIEAVTSLCGLDGWIEKFKNNLLIPSSHGLLFGTIETSNVAFNM